MRRNQTAFDRPFHGFGFQNATVRAGPIVQPHADELHILGHRAIKAVTTHIDLGIIGQRKVIQRRQRSVLAARMDRRAAGLHRVGAGKGDLVHAQLIENAFAHNRAKALATDAFDHLTDPVDVGAVFPTLTRIEQQRRFDRRARGGHDRGLPVLFGQTLVDLVKEVIAKARRVQQQLARGDIGFGCAQTRVAVGVKAFDHL